MGAEPLLEVENLTVSFMAGDGWAEVLHGVDLHVHAGETLVVLGESGSGKSVTAAAVMDLLDCPPARISAGRILFHGEDLLTMEARRRRDINGKRIAIIFQDPLAYLHPLYTIGRQIAEALVAHGEADGAAAWTEAVRLLTLVGIPDPERRARQYPHQFSGGQRQRVMIAMALAMRPELLIADEPTTALDVTVQAGILKLLRQLSAEMGMALILITHDLSVAAHMGDRVAVMRKGRVVETGPMERVFADPQHPYTQELLAAMPGGASAARRAGDTAPLLVEVEHLTKDYHLGGFGRGQVIHAVRDVSFQLRRGETLAIVGESGSGKSTVAKLLMRLEPITAGTVRYRGTDITALRGADWLRHCRRMQMVFQDPFSSLNPSMTVGRIIAEPWTVHRDIVPRARWRERVAELLAMVGLSPEHAERHPHAFSGGQRQRIAIARALACEPEVLICDEAVSSLDLSIQAQVIDLLSDLRDRLGLSYLFISHDLHVVRDFADRVLVMKHGEIVEEGVTERVFTSPAAAYTRELVGATPKPRWEEDAAADGTDRATG